MENSHGALRPQRPLRLLRDGEVGRSGNISNTYSLHCHHQNDSASSVSHFNVSLIVWATSQDSVHKPQFLKRKESRRGSNRGHHTTSLATANAANENPSSENRDLPDVMSFFKTDVGQNTALATSFTARNSTFLITAFPIYT